MNLKGQTILIVSNEPWGDVWYSKHNYANELAKENTVFWIDPPSKWRFSNLFKRNVKSVIEKNNLYIVSYNNILPRAVKNRISFWFNELVVSRALKKHFKKKSINNFLFWTFDPFRLKNPKRLSATYSIYQCMDDYDISQEDELCPNVDMIIYYADVLKDKLKKYNKPMLYIPQAISKENFYIEEEAKVPKVVEDSFLYVGNIDLRIDFELIFYLSKALKNEKFVFVGPNNLTKSVKEKINNYSNIIILPPVHFKELKNYIAKAKGCLAIKKTEHKANMINYHKILQYLAFGKDVFAPALSEYQSENSHLLCIYSNKEECLKLMQDKISKPSSEDLRIKRITYAKSLTYDRILDKINDFLLKNGCRF